MIGKSIQVIISDLKTFLSGMPERKTAKIQWNNDKFGVIEASKREIYGNFELQWTMVDEILSRQQEPFELILIFVYGNKHVTVSENTLPACIHCREILKFHFAC